jgi:hypothetical protein
MERFWLLKPFAQCKRLKENVIESGLRVQRESPTHVLLQLRVHSKNGGFGSGTISHVSLSKAEVLHLSGYLASVAEDLHDK